MNPNLYTYPKKMKQPKRYTENLSEKTWELIPEPFPKSRRRESIQVLASKGLTTKNLFII